MKGVTSRNKLTYSTAFFPAETYRVLLFTGADVFRSVTEDMVQFRRTRVDAIAAEV